MGALLVLIVVAAALATVIVRVWSRRYYGADRPELYPDYVRRRAGKVFYRCFRIA